jgi:hypothetical protein
VSISELLRFSNNDIAALQLAGKLKGWSINTPAALQLAGAKFVGVATRVALDERRIKVYIRVCSKNIVGNIVCICM